MNSIRRRLLLLGATLCISVGLAQATIYVAKPPFGSNTTGNGTPTKPYATIQFAYNQSPVQGETIIVAPGTYSECVVAQGLTVQTSPGVFQEKWVKIRANHPDPVQTKILGNGICAPVKIGGLAGTLEGFTIQSGGDSAIKASGSVTLLKNVINSSSALNGGGIRYDSTTCQHGAGNVLISQNTISGNSATQDGGGISVDVGASVVGLCQSDNITVSITDNIIENNQAGDDGGGVDITTNTIGNFSAIVTAEGNTVRGNAADSGILCCSYGGGIRALTLGKGIEQIFVRDNLIESNSASTDGGGIDAWMVAEVSGKHLIVLDDNVVNDNVAAEDGGGIASEINAVTMAAGQRFEMLVTNNSITNNLSGGGAFGGGGMLARFYSESTLMGNAQAARFLVSHNTITGNQTGLVGGGMSVSAEANIDGTEQTGCQPLVLNANAVIDIENNLVAHNIAENPFPASRGGGIATFAQACGSSGSNSAINLLLNTIAHNETTIASGGVELAYFSLDGALTAVDFSHNVIANNEGTGVGGVPPTGNWRATFDHNNLILNFGSNYAGWLGNPSGTNGNINALPHFKNPDANDYRSTFISPMIDAGVRMRSDVPLVDLEGGLRVVDGNGDGTIVIDTGADEYYVCTDADVDGYGDPVVAADQCDQDNCPAIFNPGQSDCDMDLMGDVCDAGAVDADGDGVASPCDSNDLFGLVCDDLDNDGCDDCPSGVADPFNDGLDSDFDGQCDLGDADDDNDGANDGVDSARLNPYVCRDSDSDGCEDCISGQADTDSDGPDFDSDGLCDGGDPDDDNDGVPDAADSAPLVPTVCRDLDADGCDDCSSGTANVGNDGLDTDADGICNVGDPDDDSDGVADGADSAPLVSTICRDLDADGCDDCSSGTANTANDGLDTDADSICNVADPDDDNDGVADGADSAPLVSTLCRDLDTDSCDDCSSGTANPANDGLDTDADGQCDVGDLDDDNDGINDVADSDPLDPLACSDTDADDCDDCSQGGAGGVVTILDEHFNVGAGAFVYADDRFRGTASPLYASGSYNASGGLTGGGLSVVVGGVNGDDIIGMSGGWSYTFNLATAAPVSIALRYALTISGQYETDEATEVLLSRDGLLVGTPPNDFIARLVGPGTPGPEINSGWQLFQADLGTLAAGPHTIVVGGYLNKKTTADEVSTIRVDDVFLTAGTALSTTYNPANDGLDTDLDGACNVGDLDDDNDGVNDAADSAPLNKFVCRDADTDSCDDCSSGTSNLANDGVDTDSDGACNVGDLDDDNDGVNDAGDSAPLVPTICRDLDTDSCDDCSSGTANPANDGLDTDTDGACNAGDLDDDNDGVPDAGDSAPLNKFVCRDLDTDSCDDCSSGTANPANDGLDTDTDGACNAGDLDDDNDGVNDAGDSAPLVATICRDLDTDSCDDCSSGTANPANDGLDSEADGLCDLGDPDDDNDGVGDGQDASPLNKFVCRDADTDGCDDCSSGTDNVASDGLDTDADGACNAGDLDDDNDGVNDAADSAPLVSTICRDLDTDSCDDCSSGTANPANDGLDTDTDGACDIGDGDDDNDGVGDGLDASPLNNLVCRDADTDGCDDCSSGTDNVASDGLDTDTDGACNAGDLDDDNDGVNDAGDSAPLVATICRDLDTDSCDDCSSGTANPANDGLDSEADGLCDLGDPDDDNDGVGDGLDTAPLNKFVCRDADTDGCDDCSSGTDNVASDGLDTDVDGACNAGDLDDDNDGVNDAGDSAPLVSTICRDLDTDSCDDCSSGTANPANDGLDTDTDGACNAGDLDDDNDGVPDAADSAPLNKFACRDADTDSCDDCSSGTDNVASDGLDTDVDGACNAGDLDDDNDGVPDAGDSAPLVSTICRDLDTDSCDDCSSGTANPANDGLDTDVDGACNAGDLDDDNDGVNDAADSAPLNKFVCRDADTDSCDDCSSGTDNVASDGLDTDTDGACDIGDGDDDNDGVGDGLDASPLNNTICRDADTDGCDDCSSGTDNVASDGLDTDTDGACDIGDGDDDNDGVGDGLDASPLNNLVCRDADTDGCDDCSSGTDNVASDGLDTDTDGACNIGDGDDDNDGVGDGLDASPLNNLVCRDADTDGCDDCSSGTDNVASDGLDTDLDGACNTGDLDDDNDGVNDAADSAPLVATICRDLDGDSCDDCSSGTDNVASDGLDTDTDGACNAGDLDDDSDGVPDAADSAPLVATICRDLDGDSCDDCSSGTDNVASDGLDADLDGACNAGDLDDDNDGVNDAADSAPLVATICRDADTDSCDDCSSGTDNVASDGLDTDLDGACDAGDLDDDNDGVNDAADSAPLVPTICRDLDGDGCDDCSGGTADPANDGLDSELDGLCDFGDPDDDNDGASDVADCAPLINSVASPAGDLGNSLRLGPASSQLSWLATADANVYNVYRGDVASGQLFAYNHGCALTEVADLEAQDSTLPASGAVLYYLVSPTNICGGDGTLGSASNGTPRPSDTPCVPQANDAEGDGVLDTNDNCPQIGNPGQQDIDLDRRGDACDNCAAMANLDQADADGDATGDSCDDCTDLDGDGFGDAGFAANLCALDNCPLQPNASQLDGDSDGLGNVCDACPADLNNDIDGDGLCAGVDNCPGVFNLAQPDSDSDGLGDACDPCVANVDPGCLACAPGSDLDGDGRCQISDVVVEQFTSMTYLANSSNPGLGQSWVAAGFIPGPGWQAGSYGVGYDTAQPPNSADALIATPVPINQKSIFTIVDFNVAVAADVERLAIAADYDDGYAAWLNGVEIYRSPELSTGALNWDAPAAQREPSNGTAPDFSDRFNVTAVAAAALQNGSNRLAIGVWNASLTSSDLLLLPQFTVEESVDNCPAIANPAQADADGDGVGDLCDSCPATPNFGQRDSDGDGLGDACDPCVGDPNLGCSNCPPGTDPDGDGVCELESVLVAEGTSLIYRANNANPGLGLSWTAFSFVPDGAWLPGSFGVGYELATSGPLAHALISTPSAISPAHSIYARAGFNLADASAALRVEVGADYDDGYVLWLNGSEIYRSPEMEPGPPAWNADVTSRESSNGLDPDYGTLIDVTTVAAPLLQSGNNVLAVGVWNATPNSSDLVVVPRLSIRTTLDNCPDLPNSNQADADGDGLGDACDPG